MNENTSSSEFLLGIEEYLRYIKNDNYADSIHTLSRTINSVNPIENSVKSIFQDFSAVLSDKNKADLLHNIVKSENIFKIQKSLLTYLGKILDDINLNDLIYGTIKSDEAVNVHKSLLQYINKLVDDTNLNDLIHGTIKSDEIGNAYKPLLQYINKLLDDTNLNDLIHGTIKTDEVENAYKPLLQYINKLLDDKNLNDLIHGTIKSDNLIIVYKTILQYVGKSVLDNDSVSILSLAICRSIESDNFEDNFIKSFLSMLDRVFLTDKIFRGITNYLKSNSNRKPINDAFSRSQIKSKIWLIEELFKINSKYDNVLLMAGWFGQLKSIYDKKLIYSKMRIVEVDKFACEISDYIFNLSNLENYKVKSVHADINNLTLHTNGYELKIENFKENIEHIEKFLPNLIINTSAEHMKEDWFFDIKFKKMSSNPIVAIQSNNLFDVEEHINCVHSIDHMKKKFPMTEILFEGELQLKGYKRVMLIGRP